MRPELTPSTGTSTTASARAARRNVPSPPSTTRQSVRAAVDELVVVVRLGRPGAHAALGAPGHRPLAQGRGPRPWSGCRRSPGATISRGAGGAGTRGCPPARQRRLDLAAHVKPDLGAWPGRHRLRPVGSLVAHHALRRIAGPTSNCGLTRATMSPPARAGPTPARTRRQRDERNVDHGQADRLGQRDACGWCGSRRPACVRSRRRRGDPCAATRRAVRAPRREHRRAPRRAATDSR
jgi:hypothetical protein